MTAPLTIAKPLPPLVIHPLCQQPSFLPELLDATANGELLVDFCKRVSASVVPGRGRPLRYADVMAYVLDDEERTKQWNNAVKNGQSWLVNRLSSELTAIGLVDIKDAFKPDGTIRDISDIPETLRRVISSIEVAEIWEDQGGRAGKIQVGVLKKIKLTDKLKAIEMLGKHVRMFVDEVVVTGRVEHVHSVEKYDLEERITMLKAGRTTAVTVAPVVPSSPETVEDAQMVSAENTPKPGSEL